MQKLITPLLWAASLVVAIVISSQISSGISEFSKNTSQQVDKIVIEMRSSLVEVKEMTTAATDEAEAIRNELAQSMKKLETKVDLVRTETKEVVDQSTQRVDSLQEDFNDASRSWSNEVAESRRTVDKTLKESEAIRATMNKVVAKADEVMKSANANVAKLQAEMATNRKFVQDTMNKIPQVAKNAGEEVVSGIGQKIDPTRHAKKQAKIVEAKAKTVLAKAKAEVKSAGKGVEREVKSAGKSIERFAKKIF